MFALSINLMASYHMPLIQFVFLVFFNDVRFLLDRPTFIRRSLRIIDSEIIFYFLVYFQFIFLTINHSMGIHASLPSTDKMFDILLGIKLYFLFNRFDNWRFALIIWLDCNILWPLRR